MIRTSIANLPNSFVIFLGGGGGGEGVGGGCPHLDPRMLKTETYLLFMLIVFFYLH